MRADEPDPVEAIVSAILNHLESHPRAADLAEGVARWWLGPTHVGVTVEQVEGALNCLGRARHDAALTVDRRNLPVLASDGHPAVKGQVVPHELIEPTRSS